MDDQPQTPPPRPLFISVIGLACALGLAVWAAMRFALHGSNIVYGALAGISFGAAFAFGQQIKNRIAPSKPRTSSWKSASANLPELRPARQAAMQAKKLRVEFDEQNIRTLLNKTEREHIRWDEIDNITITISDEFLPMPQWLLIGRKREDQSPKGMLVPNDAEGLDGLMDAFKLHLPGYGNDQTYATVIAAMAAMEGSFPVWSRGAADAATPTAG
ncbi:anaphase-promoting protein [Herbaspirillum lusitanum]|uniref:Anaphase-promoting protein n=1 Tax=Herbaspirillum lusitanum TaxID=213312 RepID=A0ABW9A6Z9_9BURK